MLYWFLKHILVGPVVTFLFKPWVEGEEHVPTEGAAIFAKIGRAHV